MLLEVAIVLPLLLQMYMRTKSLSAPVRRLRRESFPFLESLHSLTLLGLHLTIFLQSDGLDLDEPASLTGLEVSDLVHAALRGVVLDRLLASGGGNGIGMSLPKERHLRVSQSGCCGPR